MVSKLAEKQLAGAAVILAWKHFAVREVAGYPGRKVDNNRH
jgi:hypothetical protein